MIATDGKPTIANASPFRITSVTLPNGVQEYVIKNFLDEEVSPRFTSSALAMRELQLMRKAK